MRLRHRPGAALVATLCLALGMGASAMSVALVDATLLRPFGIPRASELVVLWESDPARPQDLIEMSLPTFQDWERDAVSFASMAAFGSSHWPGIGRWRGESFPIAPRAVSQGFFATIGLPPALGRTFADADLSPAAPPPAILAHAFWMSRFGGALDIVGRELVIDNLVHRIAGVMPKGFAFPDAPDVWISVERALAAAFAANGMGPGEQRYLGVLQAVGRLRPGRTRQEAVSELNAIERAIGQQHWPSRPPLVAVATPLGEVVLGNLGARLWIALAMTAAVLLFACANVAALLMARLGQRTGELAARLCLGASPGRLFRQLLGETIPLIGISTAGAVGIVLAIEAWLRQVPVVVASGIDLVRFRSTAALALAAAAAVSWLLVSVGPALAAIRRVSPAAVTPGSRTVARGSRATASLLLVQAALAVCLVSMATSAYRMFAALARTDMGFATSGVTALDVSKPDWKYADPAARASLEARLLSELSSLPGVSAVGGVSVRPFRFSEIADGIPVRRPEDVTAGRTEWIDASRVVVSPGYFDAMGIAIEEGRKLADFDGETGQRVAVLSRGLARMLWGDQPALGRAFEYGTGRGWNRTIVVGIAGDVRSRALGRPALEVYIPNGQGAPSLGSFVVRHAAGADMSETRFRTALRAVDADLVIERTMTTRAIVDRVLAPSRLLSTSMTMLGATGLMLLALGIFGAAATALHAARREIGIRQAIGATPAAAAHAPLRSLVSALTAGALIGAVAAPGAVGVLAAMGVAEPGGTPLALGGGAAAVVAAAGLAIGINIRRATAVPAAELLRAD